MKGTSIFREDILKNTKTVAAGSETRIGMVGGAMGAVAPSKMPEKNVSEKIKREKNA